MRLLVGSGAASGKRDEQRRALLLRARTLLDTEKAQRRGKRRLNIDIAN